MLKKKNLAILLMITICSIFGLLKSVEAVTATQNSLSKSNPYKIQSSYLKDPGSIIKIADQSAKFWYKAYDKEFGGFFTNIKRDGTPDMNYTVKSSIIQSRDAYGFARAYMMTGKDEYLEYAQHALDYLYKHAWDEKNDGWYQNFERDGSLAKPENDLVKWNTTKWSFNQHYSLVGISAMYDATRSSSDWDWLKKGYDANNKHLWDSTKGFEGYFDYADTDWSNKRGKGFTPTVDAITTNALGIYLLTGEKQYKKRLLELADIIDQKLVPTMKDRKILFAEAFDGNWNIDYNQPNASVGHAIKTAWCLGSSYIISPSIRYKNDANKILTNVLKVGYDNKYGGPYMDYNGVTGEKLSDNKDWWMLEQAITGGLTNYYISKNENYLKMADESLDFLMNNMYDEEYGELFSGTTRDGSSPITDQKGNYWKGAYHSMETFYYVYTYGNLYLQKKPVSLYYKIEATSDKRSLHMEPIAMPKGKLRISSITLNGKEYAFFDANALELDIAENVGGEFKITYISN